MADAKQRKRAPRKGEGRPPYQPTDKDRAEVQAMFGYGMRQEDIAAVKRIDPKTLRKYYRNELDTGNLVAVAKVAESLYKNAVEHHNVTAQIFFLCNRAREHWQSVTHIQHSGTVDHDHNHSFLDEFTSRIDGMAARFGKGEAVTKPNGSGGA